jgi:hypothetical protein
MQIRVHWKTQSSEHVDEVQFKSHMVIRQEQANKFSAACDQISVLTDALQALRTSLAMCFEARVSTPPAETQSKSVFTANNRDTKCNIIVSGIAESRNVGAWSDLVGRALQTPADKEVKFYDTFRLGGFFADRLPRPILVKLHMPWDRRIEVSWHDRGQRGMATEGQY